MSGKRAKQDRRRAMVEAYLRTLRPVEERPPGYDSIAADAASEDDRLYFEAHPERNWRVRPGIDGELTSPAPRWIAVLEVEPGYRLRLPVHPSVTDEQARVMDQTGRFEGTGSWPLWKERLQ